MRLTRSIACGIAGIMIGLGASPAYAALNADVSGATFATASTATGENQIKPEDEAKIMDVMSKIGVMLYSPFDTSRSTDTAFAEVAQAGNIESLIGNPGACDDSMQGQSYQALSAADFFSVVNESSFPQDARCTLAAYLYHQRGLSSEGSVAFPITAVDYSQIEVTDDTHITVPSSAVTYGFTAGNPDVMLSEYHLVNVDGQWMLDLSENYTELMVSSSSTPTDGTTTDSLSGETETDTTMSETEPTVDGELAVTGSRTAMGAGVIALLLAAVGALGVVRRRATV